MQTKHRAAGGGGLLTGIFLILAGLLAVNCTLSSPNPNTSQQCTVTFVQPPHGSLTASLEGGTTITSGKTVKKGTVVVFNAHPAASQVTIKQWTGLPGNTTTTGSIQRVTVEADINVSVVFEPEPIPSGKIRIIFGNTITCSNKTTSPSSPVGSYSYVEENTKLEFSTEAEIQDWLINGKSKSQTKPFNYIVKKADAQDSTITVTYTKKEQPEIVFDFRKMEVNYFDPGNNSNIPSGSKVAYGTSLIFTVKSSSGSIVEKWTINKIDKTNKFQQEGTNRYRYTVAAEDVTDGKLHFAFTEKKQSSGTIAFEEDKIAVYKREGTELKQIAKESPISEGQELAFFSKLSLGTIVKEWQINGTSLPDTMDKQYVWSHIVKASDFTSSKMTIGITARTSQQGTITLGEGVTCYRVNPRTSDRTPLNEGASVQETDYLAVQSTKSGKGTWKLNGKKPDGFPPVNNTEFLVKKEYFDNTGKLKIEFIK